MFHSNVHSQPYTLASLVSSAWQLASNTAMSLIHNIQPHEDAIGNRDSIAAVPGEKVFPSSAAVQVRKNNRQKKDVVDLQESAPNSMSPPRAIPIMSDAATSSEQVEVVCETDTIEVKKRRRGGRRRNMKKGEADQAETVTAGVVDGSNNDVDNGGDVQNQQQEKKEGRRRRNNKNRKEKELLGDGDIQGDIIAEQPSTEDKVEQKPKQQRQRQRNAKKTDTEKNDDSVKPQDAQVVEVITVTETTPEIEKVSEGLEEPTEGVPTQTKGNRRRQRQRENKKKGKLVQQQQQQQEQLQGDVEEQTGDAEAVATSLPTPAPTPSPSQSPPPTNKSEKQSKRKKKQNNNKKSKQNKERPPSPKEEEPNNGLYKNSVLKHLFLKQHGTDSLVDNTAHEVVIKPIRQPRGPTAIGDRGFSADYRNSRTVKV